MSDHESFLKLLGFEEEGVKLKGGALSESAQREASSVVEIEADSNSGSQASANTEWDLGPDQNAKVPDEAHYADEAENFSAENQGWPEKALEEQHLNEDFEKLGTRTEKLLAEELVERTEPYSQVVAEAGVAENPIEDKTAVYTNADIQSVSTHTKKSKTGKRGENSRVGHTKSIRLEQEQTKGSRGSAKTAGTVPFEYVESSAENRENKTAHFDYEEEEGHSRIVLLEGNANTKAVHLNQFPIKIGRDPENDLALDDVNASRFHAEIQNKDAGIFVVDLGSTNGVKVNGEVVSEHLLQANDIIQIGDCLLEFLPSGMLSKGAPKVGALQATISGVDRKKKRRLVLIAAALLILAGFVFLLGKKGDLEESAKIAVQKVAADRAVDEVQQIRSAIEQQFQKKISSVSQTDLKKVFLERLENSKLAGFIPVGFRDQIGKLPPIAFKLMLEDPQMISEIVQKGASAAMLDIALRNRLNILIEKRNFVDALSLAEFLQSTNPKDTSLQQAVVQLKKLTDAPGGAGEGISRGYANLTEDEKKFYEYMDAYDRNHDELVAQNRFSQALSFAKLVRQKLGDLLKLEGSFERVAKPEMEKWERRLEQLERKVSDSKRQEDLSKERRAQIEKEIRGIKLHLDLGEVTEARKSIDEFLNSYGEAPEAAEVKQLKAEINSGLDKTFSTTRTNVERFVKTENYENAWKEIYRFLDEVPNYDQAVDLKTSIEKVTRPKAVQYYNQARVYEYEADDLVAAEQYYKRAIEVADPRSDIAQKAGRRYAEVKQKTIH
jgi:outer membrane protein assembly factor BamD (BamD/ComL family)